jgi:hypothetical protein
VGRRKLSPKVSYIQKGKNNEHGKEKSNRNDLRERDQPIGTGDDRRQTDCEVERQGRRKHSAAA